MESFHYQKDGKECINSSTIISEYSNRNILFQEPANYDDIFNIEDKVSTSIHNNLFRKLK